MTELQVILDVGCIMSKMCTQPSTTQPVLSPVLSQSFAVPSELRLGWFIVQSTAEHHLQRAYRLQFTGRIDSRVPGSSMPLLQWVRVAKVKKKWGILYTVGRRINWYNQVGRTCFIIKAKDAFTVLQCNNSTSPCIQKLPLKCVRRRLNECSLKHCL